MGKKSYALDPVPGITCARMQIPTWNQLFTGFPDT
jgi:hypothetical protein